MIGLAFIIKAGFFVAGVVQAAAALTEIKTAKVLEKNEVPQIDDNDIKSEEVKKQVTYLNEVSEEYTNNNIGLCKIKALLSAGISLECFTYTNTFKLIESAPISFKLKLLLAVIATAMTFVALLNLKRERKNYKEVIKAYEQTSDEAFDTDDDDEVFDDYQEV